MTGKRRTDRDEKLQKLKDGTLTGRLKADFQFKIAKILERELIRLEELSSLLDATPDNYLENINFRERAIAAMSFTQKLINKTYHAPVVEKDGIKYATKNYLIKSFPGFEELDDSVLMLPAFYEPIDDDLLFDVQLKEFLKSMSKIINDPVDHQIYSMEEYNSVLRPRIRKHSKTGLFKTGQPILVTPTTTTNGPPV